MMGANRSRSFIVTDKNNLGMPVRSSVSIELLDTDKGFLMNRLTTEQRDALVEAPEGLTIYNTDSQRIEVFDGQRWERQTEGALLGVNNLSDLTNLVAARSNLGLGSASTRDVADFNIKPETIMQLPDAEPLDGSETLLIIQNNQLMKISLASLKVFLLMD